MLRTLRSGSNIPCTECQAGIMRREFVTYFTWIGEELITVPDFPAWVCDVCGRREYDLQALNRLSLLLDPSAGQPTKKRRSKQRKTGVKPSQTSRKEN